MRHLPWVTLATLSLACGQGTLLDYGRCDVSLDEALPNPAEIGESVTLAGGPQTTVWDTAVYVGSARATVLELTRSEGCDTCDECRADQGCTTCGDCAPCDVDCSADCLETITFEVPADAPVGDTSIVLYNGEGASQPLAFTVTEQSGGDGGAADGGGADGGAADGGAADGGGADGGAADGGAADGGAADGGAPAR